MPAEVPMLMMLEGACPGQRVFVDQAELVIGRDEECNLAIPDRQVSRRHARIYMRDGTCFVEDLDSTNGSFLNGDRITPYLPYAFHDGDVLSFGSLQLRFRISTADDEA